jgi:hypothetical protein
MSHPFLTKFYVLNLRFKGEAHASPLSNNIRCFEFVFLGEAHASPHQTKFVVLNLCFWGEAYASPLLSNFN